MNTLRGEDIYIVKSYMGVTAKMASTVPAPTPARNCSPMLSLPLLASVTSIFLHQALAPNRIPALKEVYNIIRMDEHQAKVVLYLGDGEEERDSQPVVKGEETSGAHGVGEARDDTSVGSFLPRGKTRLELELGFDKLHGPDGDAFNTSRHTARSERYHWIYLFGGLRHDELEGWIKRLGGVEEWRRKQKQVLVLELVLRGGFGFWVLGFGFEKQLKATISPSH